MKEAWDFYLSLFTNENVAIRIGVYGATLATLTFLITFVFKPIFSSIKRNSGKLKVKHSINQQLIQTYGIYQDMSAGDPLFTVIITNNGNMPKYVRSINIKTSKKINGYDQFAAPNVNGAFPVKLEPGQQFKHDFSISALTRDVFNLLSPYDKVQFLVYDTSNNKYYSEKVKVKQLTMQLSVAQSFNLKR
jgi:hypothetical protein